MGGLQHLGRVKRRDRNGSIVFLPPGRQVDTHVLPQIYTLKQRAPDPESARKLTCRLSFHVIQR